MTQEILVYADWTSLTEPTTVGVLSADIIRGNEQFRFAYDAKWLESIHAQKLDPELKLYAGDQFASQDHNFRVFLDSCPDRWGRLLMKRREAVRAHQAGRKPQPLMETDYLLGVNDLHRMGALRFKKDVDGPFLDDDEHRQAPPLARLRELQHAAGQLEEHGDLDDPEYLSWLNMLISPGSSLGGARPKASVIDEQGGLWIAKFPSQQDGHDVAQWEYLVSMMAADAGIVMSESRIERFNDKYHTFLTKRFDRDQTQRLHFSSAMTQLGYDDGESSASYLELAEFLTTHGSNSAEDLAQLWRRIVFNIAVSNTDDHLRNHGFIYDDGGWRLSPAYDMNPEPTGTGLHLFVSDDDNRLDYDLAMSVTGFFQLRADEARDIQHEVLRSVATWRDRANQLRISAAQQGVMAPAFNTL